MPVVSSFGGIGSLAMDSKDNKLTVSGDFNLVKVANKLREFWHTDIVSVGPAKEDDGKKDEGKKEERKKDDQVANLIKAYQAYCPTPVTHYCVPPEGTPNCVIC
ncbi:heavy metal-associated isoprenylated plant protein 12-like [Eucalyptus grandis]|uniref:heavy metal-associated isoprenylated plant protein 12-like n=1 Tax=Eucalyptus grandis TaxID=71139 RepID=UPI00192EDD0A|nr:heavy metal-associated isoprenylated plant protein 12-like [Eucalyptus grandis]